MMMMARIFLCALFLFVATAAAVPTDASFEDASMKMVLKVYDDCSKSEGFSPCLKKKALTILDRLGRMEKLSFAEGVAIVKDDQAVDTQTNAIVSEEQLESSLPRAADAKDAALNTMLMERIANLISTRKVQISLPKVTADDVDFEGRKKKGMGMMGGMMMGMAAKMAAMIPLAIAGLFLLAGKALITAKIALLISGIIAIKKLFGSKGGSGGHGGSGGGGGWQSSGGGWDKRSFDEAQKLAYKAYS